MNGDMNKECQPVVGRFKGCTGRAVGGKFLLNGAAKYNDPRFLTIETLVLPSFQVYACKDSTFFLILCRLSENWGLL